MPAVQSMTLRGVAIMVIAYIFQLMNITVESSVIAQAVDGITALIFLLGTALATIGRWRASRQITKLI